MFVGSSQKKRPATDAKPVAMTAETTLTVDACAISFIDDTAPQCAFRVPNVRPHAYKASQSQPSQLDVETIQPKGSTQMTQPPRTPAQQRSAAITAPPSGKLNLNKPASDQGDLRRFLQTPLVQEQVAGIIPKHLTPERVTGLMLSATMRQPKLLRCSMMSILQTMIQVSEVGLEISPAFGHLYLIPYENRKQGTTELQMQLAYGGLAQLVFNATGLLLSTVPVYSGDPFVMREGSEPYITHEVNLDADRTANGLRAVYCRVESKTKCELMTRTEIDDIRKRSKSATDGPWVTDYVQMARKSVLRRMTKTLPKSAENQHNERLARALEIEDGDATEVGEEKPSQHLPASRSIISAVPSNFTLTAQDDNSEQPPAQVDNDQPDENGVLPDVAPLPDNADEADRTIHALRLAADADAVRALKPQVEALRAQGHARSMEVGQVYAEAAKRVQR